MFAELAVSIALNSSVGKSCQIESHLNSTPPDVIGYSRNVANNQLLYEERYFYNFCQDKDLVVYSTDDKVISWKIISKSINQSAPNIEQMDLRFNQYIRTRIEDDQIKFFYRQDEQSELKNTNVSLEKNQVIDAGFHDYIQLNWSSLIEGEEQYFSFASPTYHKNIGMKVSRISNDKCQALHDSTQAVHCFDANPTNLLFNLFSDPIQLVYDTDKRLLSFTGVTNILKSKSDNYFAQIKYEYTSRAN